MDDVPLPVGESVQAFRYGDIEAAIGSVFGVQPATIRARLRHLRRHGIPQGLTAPGSGNTISYSIAQAVEMLFAIALESVGAKPAVLASLANRITQLWERHVRTPEEAADELIVIVYAAVVDPRLIEDLRMYEWAEHFGAVAIMDLRGVDQLANVITQRQVPPVRSTIEVSRLAARFLEMLSKSTEAE